MASRHWLPHWIRAFLMIATTVLVAGCQSSRPLPPPVSPPVSSPPAQAVTPQPEPLPPQKTIQRVALLVPLSGANAKIGQALHNAATMAVFDMAEDSFILQPYDTAGTPEGARRAIFQALAEGAHLILGPLTSGETRAVAPIVHANTIRLISFSSDPRLAGNGLYVFGLLANDQTKAIVTYARETGATRFAILAPRNDYGQMINASYTQAVQDSGGTIAQTQFYTVGEDMEAKVQALTQKTSPEIPQPLPFDAVLLPESGNTLQDIALLLTRYGVDGTQAHLLGTTLWSSPSVASNPFLSGARFPAPPPEGYARFKSHYQALYGEAPPDIAVLGYDATAMAAALARLNPQQPFSDHAITNETGFIGVNGLFRFHADGTSERGFAILEVRPEGAITLVPAPQTFPATRPEDPGLAPSATTLETQT